VDGYRYFSACVATYLDWTILFYFPRITPNGGFKDSLFSHERFGTREQISARLGGYISRLHEGALHSEPEDSLIKVFRRSPKIIDVVLSPHVVRPSYFNRFNLETITWKNTRVKIFYHPERNSAGVMSLPLFVSPQLQNIENLQDSFRFLKHALRKEMDQLAKVAVSKWSFLNIDYRARQRSLESFRRKMKKLYANHPQG
jgi:hypothetical protein